MKNMVLRLITALSVALVLTGCALFQNVSNSITGCNQVRSPGVGQWVDYGGCEPPINGNAFVFPSVSSGQIAGYFYTKLPSIPQVGQTLTLTYDVIGNNPQWVQHDPADTNPPTLHLFIWQNGDNISCQGDFNFYRLFNRNSTPLVLGSGQSISIKLSGALWQGCYPNQVLTDARLQIALNNSLGLGVVFGGQNFDGHGIQVSGGSAQFFIRGFQAN